MTIYPIIFTYMLLIMSENKCSFTFLLAIYFSLFVLCLFIFFIFLSSCLSFLIDSYKLFVN